MRGKAFFCKTFFTGRRITPAYAGKSLRHFFHKLRIGDHPRLCGEKWAMHCRRSSVRGSPPPMRGKVSEKAASISVKRITPAYAGKRLYTKRLQPETGDHPRLCGEKSSVEYPARCEEGSPPPMRGKVRVGEAYSRAYRITPAYAGKSSIVSPSSAVDWDHPRLCGEKENNYRLIVSVKGSPPPMRGKACHKRKFRRGIRITPAYAGKSRYFVSGRRDRRDHPRLCGEKLNRLEPLFCTQGSPPPMRGKATVVVLVSTPKGITPAYAGKSFRKTAVRHAIKDHPRLCGEKPFAML